MRPEQDAPEYQSYYEYGFDNTDASMRPEQDAPEYPDGNVQQIPLAPASMRPEQDAPEYRICRWLSRLFPIGFNEAGAGCSGIQLNSDLEKLGLDPELQ